MSSWRWRWSWFWLPSLKQGYNSSGELVSVLCRSVGPSVVCMVGKLVGRSVGWTQLIGRIGKRAMSVRWSVGRLHGWSVGRSVGRLVGRLVTQSFDNLHVAPYWPTWPCFSLLTYFTLFPTASKYFDIYKLTEKLDIFLSSICSLTIGHHPYNLMTGFVLRNWKLWQIVQSL